MTTTVAQQPVSRWDTLPPVRPFPVSAMRLIKISSDPSSDVQDLVSIVETDPGYAAKLMQVANSAVYGMSGRVRSIQQAVVVLGFRKLHDITVTLAATEVFSQGDECRKQREQLWNHSLACAVTAQQIAKRLKLPPDEAFLGGILHDVGKLVMLDLAAEEYSLATRDFDRLTSYPELTDLENAAFGQNHQELGMLCADEWGLPFAISSIIGYHHNPEESPDDPELAELMRLTNQLVDCWNLTGEKEAAVEPETSGVKTSLEITHDVMESVRSEAEALYEDVRSVCSLSSS